MSPSGKQRLVYSYWATKFTSPRLLNTTFLKHCTTLSTHWNILMIIILEKLIRKMVNKYSDWSSFNKLKGFYENGTLLFIPYLGYGGCQSNILLYQQRHVHLVLQPGHLVFVLLYQLLLQRMVLHLTIKNIFKSPTFFNHGLLLN